MFWEKKLENWINTAKARTNAELPLRLELWNGRQYDFSPAPPQVTVRVPELSALSYLLNPTLDNLGSAYVENKLHITGRLNEMINIGNQLAETFADSFAKNNSRFKTFFKRSHSKKVDAEAIHYHYDVSNEFYSEWLDPNMVYSCGYFENGDEDLATAQIKKIDHILTKIQLKPGQTLLDIGCGWGGLVIRAAQKFGARCVGITLSQNQYKLATERVKAAGLSDQVEIRIQDYRDVRGTFDRITSVGMFEHVGLKNLRTYFAIMQSLLKEDGIAMNHGITSTDANSGETPFGGGDFIEKYVFPHGELPHIGLVLKTMQEGGLEAHDIENLRHHYAKTCDMWSENYENKAEIIKNLTDEKRYRIWRVYLAGCAYAFAVDRVALYQVVCTKSGHAKPLLPNSRRYMYS